MMYIPDEKHKVKKNYCYRKLLWLFTLIYLWVLVYLSYVYLFTRSSWTMDQPASYARRTRCRSQGTPSLIPSRSLTLGERLVASLYSIVDLFRFDAYRHGLGDKGTSTLFISVCVSCFWLIIYVCLGYDGLEFYETCGYFGTWV